MNSKKLTAAVLLLFFLVFILLSVWFFFRSGLFPPASRVWRGYYTVVFRGGGNKKLLVERLKKGKYLKNIISVYTCPVMFYDFSGFKWVIIDKLDRYLDREDPRYDDYLRNARNFFVAFSGRGNYEILYVPSVKNPLIVYLKLARLFRGTNFVWHFLDFSPLISLFSVLFFLGFSFSIVKGWKKPRTINSIGRYFIYLGIIPWILVVLDGDIVITGFAFILFPLYVSISVDVYEKVDGYSCFNSDKNNRRMRDLLFLLGVFLFMLPFLIVTGERFVDVLPLLWVLVFDLILIGAMVVAVKGERILYSHGVFRPVRIMDDFFMVEGEGVKKKNLLVAVGVFMFFGIVVFAIGNLYGDFVVPQPRKFHFQKGMSEWRRFDSLWKTTREMKIPNISHYVAHRAYQETLKFNYGYVEEKKDKDWFPVENSALYLREFSYDRYKNKIFGRKIVVKHFDENWLKGILLEIKDNSFEKIIENQGGIVSVDYFPLKELPYWKWHSLEFIVLIIGLTYYLFFFNRKWFFSTKISYDFGGLYEES